MSVVPEETAVKARRSRVTPHQKAAHAAGYDQGYEEGRAGASFGVFVGTLFGTMLGAGVTALYFLSHAA